MAITTQQALRARRHSGIQGLYNSPALNADPIRSRPSPGFCFLFFILIRDNIQFERVRVDDFQFGAALGAVKLLAFLDVVLEVNHGLAIWTVGHKTPQTTS